MDETKHPLIETREDARDPDVPERTGRTGHYVFSAAIAAALLLGLLGDWRSDGIVAPGGLPFAFVLFVLVLLGVALFHGHTLRVALGGAAVITLYTALFAHDDCPFRAASAGPRAPEQRVTWHTQFSGALPRSRGATLDFAHGHADPPDAHRHRPLGPP